MAPPGTARLLDDRYQLDSQIADGRFAEIWRGTDVILARPIAVKMLRPEFAEDGEVLARFRAEARIGGTVAHGNIARIYDCDEPGPGHPPFLIMELVDGLSLAEVLTRGPLDPARTMDVVAQAAAGLAAAHRAGLVHGDIRPGNLLLAGGNVIKITGFGRPHSPSAGLSPASDLYDLGIVAGQCLASGFRPAGAEAEAETGPGGYQVLPVLPDTVPEAVAALIGELTAEDTAERPDNAYEVSRRAGDLRDEAAGEAAGPATGQLNLWLEPPAGTGPAGGTGELAAAQNGAAGPAKGALAGPAAASTDAAGADAAATGPGGRRPGAPAARRPHPLRRAAIWAAGTAVVALVVILVSDPELLHPASTPAGQAGVGVGVHANVVKVSNAALDGLPVGVVRTRLQSLGLTVHIRWQVSHRVASGRVLSVTPSGTVPAHSVVLVTGALSRVGAPHPPISGTGGSAGGGNGGEQQPGQPQPTTSAGGGSPSPIARPSGSASPTPIASKTAPVSPPPTTPPPISVSPTPTPTPTPSPTDTDGGGTGPGGGTPGD